MQGWAQTTLIYTLFTGKMTLVTLSLVKTGGIYRPVAFKENQEIDFDLTENPYPTWQKLEELVERGKIRNIGVSKYVLSQLPR